MDNKVETFTFFGGEPFTPEQNDLSIKRVFIKNENDQLELIGGVQKSTPIDLLGICIDNSKPAIFRKAYTDLVEMYNEAKAKADKWDELEKITQASS